MFYYAPIMEMVVVAKNGDEKAKKNDRIDKKELRKRYVEQDSARKALLLKKLVFCKFADHYEFENYFSIGELRDRELLGLASFLNHNECFLMLMDIMNHYKERFTSLLQSLKMWTSW